MAAENHPQDDLDVFTETQEQHEQVAAAARAAAQAAERDRAERALQAALRTEMTRHRQVSGG